MGRLPGLLADDLTRRGVRVRTSTTVRAVSTGKERRFSVTVGPTMAEERILADAVVLATPPTAASRLLAQLIPEAATALGEVESSSSAVVTLALPRAGLPDFRDPASSSRRSTATSSRARPSAPTSGPGPMPSTRR